MGELAESFEYGLNASAKKFDGSNKYIRITDIDDISHKFNQSGVTTPDIDFANANNYKLKKGDILFARTGASVGKTYMYRESDGLVYYAGFLIRARIKSKISSEFVFQTTFTDSYNQFIKITSQRSGQPGVNAEEYSNFKIMIPNYEEQKAIGCFLKKVDDTIALHQRKLEQLKRLKQGFLQVLFANDTTVPRVRFAGFTEEWEQRKLSELATMNARIGWQNLRTSEFLDNGDYMLITGTDFKDGTIDYSNIHYVEKERFEQDKKIQISNGSILITKDGTLGKVAYVEGLTMPATLNAGVFNVRVKEELAIDSRFLFHYLKAPFLLKFADQRSTGGTIKHLNQNVLVEFPIPLPSLEEQHKVAGLLSTFDNTLALHQMKLSQLKNLKKALLQSMFI